MIFYILYRLGQFIAVTLPLAVAYKIAVFLANLHFYICPRDRAAVIDNMQIILGYYDKKKVFLTAREVFKNFAKYLVDFFRFSLIDAKYIERYVRVEGLENVDEALSRKKGVIVLSAHLGNWELGGFILSTMRRPVKAVVLTHKNKKVNEFFREQRTISGLEPIEIGITLRGCYRVLRGNGLLALLGDRDFSKNGFHTTFFGRQTQIPKGPAVLSYRLGSPIVPSFMIRQPGDTFRLIFERPIYPDAGQSEAHAEELLAGAYSSVIESYVRRYPSQWYMFRKVWNNNEEPMRPDTII